MAADHIAELSAALEKLGFVKVVRSEESATQIRLLCRVTNKKAWCVVLERLLRSKKDWSAHICQQYFLKEDSLVYGWNFIINADDPVGAAQDICRLLSIPERVDVDSFPLRGAWRPTGTNFNPAAPGTRQGGASQRGAFPIGAK
jgi:hypothetical protein